VKRIITITTAVLFLAGGVALGQERNRGFGTLDNMTNAEAKTKLAAWLKDAGKSDAGTLQKLDAIWQESNRGMLDRVADSFALGDPLANQLLAEARDPGAPAPIIVPEVFKSDKNQNRPAFFRANLGLIYARALINRRVYEEALDTLKLFSADQMMDPAAYLFHRAVCEHALQRKAEATKSIVRLLDEGSAISPERYKTVAALMLVDMVSWKDKDLGDIARKMENIERRLDIARGGPETHRQQREVLNRLDEIIKKLENQDKNKKKIVDGPPGDGPPSDGQGEQCPDGGQKPGQGQGPPKGTDPSKSPAQDSANAGGSSTGNVDQAKFKKLVADWGRLPPADQRRALQELVQGMPPRHREAIVNYFQNLTNPALNRR
jgi:hypothetical protein